MARIVQERVFKVPARPKEVTLPDGYRVFLKYMGDDAEEIEASPGSVAAHVHLTGSLPVVGKPLYASVAGSDKLTIPYGEVIRIETKK